MRSLARLGSWLAPSLLLGACLGAPSAQPPAPAPAAALALAGAPAPPTRQSLRIGYAAPSASFLPAFVAQEGGLFEREGLDVTLQQIQNNVGMAALVTGELEVYDVASGALVPAVLSGADLVLIASDSNRTIFGLITTPDLQSPADLRGKTLGLTTRGASDDFVTQRYLQARGLDPHGDVVMQPVGGIPEKLVAMEVGHISGGLVSPPTLFVALDRGMKLLDQPAELFEYQGSGLVVQRARLQGPAGERLGHALARAHLGAIRAIFADRALALRALDRYAPSPSPEIAERTLDWALRGLPPDGLPTLEGLRAVIEDTLQARGSTATLEPASLVETRFLRAAGEPR
jgi:NitT/TauT family transport system substrate-binding protein